MRRFWRISRIGLALVALGACVLAQSAGPQKVTLNELIENPARFDGTLIQVSADFQGGWEGDNFLVGPLKGPRKIYAYAPHVWFQCRTQEGCKSLKFGRDSGTFTGYFHLVFQRPDNHMYDPGPLQLDVIGFVPSAQNTPPWFKALETQEAEATPREVSVDELLSRAILYEGQLIKVRMKQWPTGRPGNLLYGSLQTDLYFDRPPCVRVYGSSIHPGVLEQLKTAPPPIATFTGYFHFVSLLATQQKAYEGPYELEVLSISDIPDIRPNYGY